MHSATNLHTILAASNVDPFPLPPWVVHVVFSLLFKAPGTANERSQLIPQEFSSLKIGMVPNQVIPLMTDSLVAQMVKNLLAVQETWV